MAETKLYYFHGVRGRVEPIRMLLTIGGVKFENVEIKGADWQGDGISKKASPFGQLPYVIYKGKKIAQSIAIATYFAKKFGVYGETDEDALRQEVVMQLAQDMTDPSIRNWIMCTDPAKKAELEQKLKTEVYPRYLSYFEDLLKENGDDGFFVGKQVTLADMYMYNILQTALGIDADALKAFPLLQKMHSNVKTVPALKDYLANRPQTAI